MTLVDAIRDAVTTERGMARKIYARIVQRDGTPDAKPSDPEDLRQAMLVLQYTPDVLERHLAARREVARLEASIPPDADGLAAALALRQDDRRQRAAALRQTRRDLLRQFRDAAEAEASIGQDALADEQRTNERISSIDNARQRVEQLRRDNALVFGGD